MRSPIARFASDGHSEVPALRWLLRAGGGVAAGLAFLAACGTEPPVAGFDLDVHTEIEGEVVLPLLEQDDPVIEATLPAGIPCRMIVDTGADTSMVDEAFVRRAGLPLLSAAPGLTSTGSDGVTRSIDTFTRIEGLGLGGASVAVLTVPVIDLSHLYIDVDGVLGHDVLAGLVALFDPPRGELRLYPPGDAAGILGRRYASGTAFVKVELEGRDLALEIEGTGGLLSMRFDTGATVSSLPRAAIEALSGEPAGTSLAKTISGESEHPLWSCRGFALGPYVLEMTVSESPEPGAGLLGYDALRPFAFLVDGPGAALYLALDPELR